MTIRSTETCDALSVYLPSLADYRIWNEPSLPHKSADVRIKYRGGVKDGDLKDGALEGGSYISGGGVCGRRSWHCAGLLDRQKADEERGCPGNAEEKDGQRHSRHEALPQLSLPLQSLCVAPGGAGQDGGGGDSACVPARLRGQRPHDVPHRTPSRHSAGSRPTRRLRSAGVVSNLPLLGRQPHLSGRYYVTTGQATASPLLQVSCI